MSSPYEGDSNDPKTPGIKGANTATTPGGAGVWGSSVAFDGVHGESQSNQHAGVTGINNTTLGSGCGVYAQGNNYGLIAKGGVTAGRFECAEGGTVAVEAVIKGGFGISAEGGVGGRFESTGGSWGVWAKGTIAGHFESDGTANGMAIEAINTADADAVVVTSSSPNHAALSGTNNRGGYGLWAVSDSKTGNVGGVGVYARGATCAGRFDGVVQVNGAGDIDAIDATTSSANHAALAGHNNGGGYGLWVESDTKSGKVGGIGIYARGATHAALFDGHIQHNGDVHHTGTVHAKMDVVLGSDCAEDFDIASATEIEPGTVMVLNEDGALQPSDGAYDKKVAGVISGAGNYEPGLILGRRDSSQDRMPLALVGKVYCKVDAQYGGIEVGDLLTTSPTPGHAMRAADPFRAFGAVIGKALRSLRTGQGLVPILIALQ